VVLLVSSRLTKVLAVMPEAMVANGPAAAMLRLML
jgi:hypothetical protein